MWLKEPLDCSNFITALARQDTLDWQETKPEQNKRKNYSHLIWNSFCVGVLI
jgi:hypothetical protein